MSYLSGRCHDGRRLVEEFVQDVLGVPVAVWGRFWPIRRRWPRRLAPGV